MDWLAVSPFQWEHYADPAEQTAAWERIKAAEKTTQPTGTLDGILLVLLARGLPSDHRAVWNALCADPR